MAVRIELVPAVRTWPLRQAVLRPHQTSSDLALSDDDTPSTASFAAIDPDETVVGTARVAAESAPGALANCAPGLASWRLRGMAVREERRGSGIGAALLAVVVEHVAVHGGGLLWCAARLPACAFYRRAGFVEHGAPWDEPHIGPHVHMWRTVDADPGGSG